jgi:hypothetical protein
VDEALSACEFDALGIKWEAALYSEGDGFRLELASDDCNPPPVYWRVLPDNRFETLGSAQVFAAGDLFYDALLPEIGQVACKRHLRSGVRAVFTDSDGVPSGTLAVDGHQLGFHKAGA